MQKTPKKEKTLALKDGKIIQVTKMRICLISLRDSRRLSKEIEASLKGGMPVEQQVPMIYAISVKK